MENVIEILKSLSIGSLSVATLILVCVEGIKKLFGLKDKQVLIAVFVCGLVFVFLAYGMSQGLLPEAVVGYVQWVVFTIVGGFGSIGLYEFYKELPKRE